MGCTIRLDVEQAIQTHRSKTTQHLADADNLFENAGPPAFSNPEPGNTVPAAVFLHHLDPDKPSINRVLKQAYPYLEHRPDLKHRVHARVKFLAWVTIKGYDRILPAYNALIADEQAPELLGFTQGIPAYDTLRECINDRLPPVMDRLMQTLLAEQKRLLDTLGNQQAQDATPSRAARFEDDCPYNGHREYEMHKAELGWDAEHEALLAQQYYHGTAHEAQLLLPINQRLTDAGIEQGTLTVDGSYTSFELIAESWEQGFELRFKEQAHWTIDAQAAREDLDKRYNEHWRHEAYHGNASIENKARFLVRHGDVHDCEAVGRWLRDRQIEELTLDEVEVRRWIRSRNEAWHVHVKRLPFEPAWQGQVEMLRRFWACCLTLHLVQLTRVQHGVSEGLCRTAHIV